MWLASDGKMRSISIHALHEEGDNLATYDKAVELLFLSTPSARRATPCGQCVVIIGVISIPALREEGDQSS